MSSLVATRADVAVAHAAAPAVEAPYRVSLATTPEQRRAAQALRFRVFNLEMREGLAESYATGLDADPFDDWCEHLVIEDARGEVVGTYRLQTGLQAAQAGGYYSAREFDFTPYEPLRTGLVELGRACIDARHRSFTVLNLLWGGIGAFARSHGARWLIGCSSLTTQDPAVAAAAAAVLAPHLVAPELRTRPVAGFACPEVAPAAEPPKIPKLLAAYLALGAGICGPPALDREFRTVDFLTLVDLESPTLVALRRRGRFGGL